MGAGDEMSSVDVTGCLAQEAVRYQRLENSNLETRNGNWYP
jgi:hypothetical protein